MSVIRVIADSVCDVPAEVAQALDITLIPTVVTIGGQSYLDDDAELSRDAFFALLPTLSELPTTAACPLGITREKVAAQAAQADHLILLTPPAHLSGIYNNFRLAAEEFAPGRYTLIDTGQVTMGAGFMVIAAAEAAQRGESVAQIVDTLQRMQAHIYIFAALNTLENIRKSGRVSWATAMAGRILGIKPVVSLRGGVVKSLANIRTFKRAVTYLEQLTTEHAPVARLAVLHTGYWDGARQLRDDLADVCDPESVLLVNVNPALGTHVGAHGLGVAFVAEQ